MLSFWFCMTIVLIIALFVYSIFPNLLTRVFHTHGIYRGPNVRTVALTFDDGPDRAYTGRVLDVLRTADVKATFFVLASNAVKEPELIVRMCQEGHEVQIHGMTHLFVPLLSMRKTKEQIQEASHLLRDLFGLCTSYYRPTWGLCNLLSFICARRTGHQLVTWSVMVGDWRITSPDVLRNRIMGKLKPGAIIVLHDSDKSFGAEVSAPENVIHALPGLISSVRTQGYRFGTLSELTGEGHVYEQPL
jgi:peptidoglycan-N-acetylglucosamine deacetylase